jgi:hypothetical protein
MRTPKGKRYCSNEMELDQYRLGIKDVGCPHCGQVGFLIGHGFLRGYSEFGEATVLRGRRFFCSNRYRRRGCGCTFSLLLADVLLGFMVRARTLWRFFQGVLSGGLSRKAAWEQVVSGGFSLESGYRLWYKFLEAQSHMRTLLLRQRPPPDSSTEEPLEQLFAHLHQVFPATDCPFSSFQIQFQTSLLG